MMMMMTTEKKENDYKIFVSYIISFSIFFCTFYSFSLYTHNNSTHSSFKLKLNSTYKKKTRRRREKEQTKQSKKTYS